MAEGEPTSQGASRRLLNLALLVGGFGLGQGSIFLAQTFLVATGRAELLALFGTHFSFAILGIIAVEAGSLTILSAEIARLVTRADGDTDSLWRAYWETTVFRLTAAIIAILILGGIAWSFELGEFSRAYAMGAFPALLLWAFNGAGFLDGLQKSGISGITGSIAYIASALALILAIDRDPGTAGLITGTALSIGYAVTVLVQFGALSALGWRPRFVTPTARGLRKAYVEEISMLAGLLPGQLYFRAQLAISSAFLGTTPTAILVYAKQIVGAASQVAGFARRVEFPRMVQRLTADPATSPVAVMGMQKGSFLIAVALAAAIVICGMVVVSVGSGFSRDAWLFLSFFAVTILSESVGQSLVQGLFAQSRYHSAAVIRILAVVVAVCFGYLFVGWLGSPVFIFSDLVSHAIVIGASAALLSRSRIIGGTNAR